MDAQYVSSTELTAAASCTRKALRYYRMRGLIEPALATGNRRYDASAIGRLRLIVALRDAGIAVDDIAALLSARGKAPADPAAPIVSGLADQISTVIVSIGERIGALQRLRERLVVARETLMDCRQCSQSLGACTECAASGKLDRTAALLLDREVNGKNGSNGHSKIEFQAD